ncbi:MetQ/NlpA family ABC transporter substrate-binding protein [Dyadobacter sp. CY261]|uniref:MetQ/NlpA family ABC transporter substrate-binding protein n=1 Tax=Dyadobacter sp. CY261 TaxID=2907203 RepID=UPI0038D4CDF8
MPSITGQILRSPIAGYSRKIKDLKDLKPAGTVVIPNNPTSGGHSEQPYVNLIVAGRITRMMKR